MELFLSVIGTACTVIATVIALRSEMRAGALRAATGAGVVASPDITPAVPLPPATAAPPAPPPRGRSIHWALWPALALSAVVATLFLNALYLYYPSYDAAQEDALGAGLIKALLDWVSFTLPVVGAAAIAVLITGSGRSRRGLAWVFVIGSTIMEVVVVTAIAGFTQDIGNPVVAIAYAASSALLTAAWLAVRDWPRGALWFGVVSGLASLPVYYAISTTGMLNFTAETFGSDAAARSAFAICVVALDVLILCVGVWAAIIWRRLRHV
jgi:hypothetical protein